MTDTVAALLRPDPPAVGVASTEVVTDDTPQLPAEFVERNPWLFSSRYSYDWFVRHYQAELVVSGALIRPTGRWLVVPAAFKRAALVIGARRAQSSGRRLEVSAAG